MVKWWAALVGLAALALFGFPPRGDGLLAVVALAWIALEASGAGGGFFLAFCLACSPGGMGILALASIPAYGLRALLRPGFSGTPAAGSSGTPGDGVATLLALLPAAWMSHWSIWVRFFVAFDLYLPLVVGLGARHLSWPRLLGSLALTMPAWVAMQSHPAALAGVVAAVLCLREAGLQQSRASGQLRQEALENELAEQRSRIQKLESEAQSLKKALTARSEELQMLENFSRELARRPELDALLDLLMKGARSSVQARSLCFFQATSAGLEPRRFDTPHSERIMSQSLLGLREPLVEESWAAHEPRQLAPNTKKAGDRLFFDEPCALAWPIEDLGVLYVGDNQRQGWANGELQLLGLLCSQAALAMRAAQQFESQRTELERHSQAHLSLESWVRDLQGALQAARVLADKLEPMDILNELAPSLQTLIPHGSRLLICRQPALEAVHANPHEGEPLRRIAESVLDNGRPLLLESASQARFADLRALSGSVVAAPLYSQDHVLGCVVLHRPEGGYTRRHQDLLSLLCFSAASALTNAHHYGELQSAYQQLAHSQAQLIQSSKMAAVGQLAAGVAHELNTPIGAMVMGAETSLDLLESRPEKARERLEKAVRAARKAEAIIARLLYYSREGRSDDQPVDLVQVVEDTLELVSSQLRVDEVNLETALAAVPTLRGNSNELQQVVTNLLLNARDAAREGGKQVRISTGSSAGEAFIEVRDNGPGLTPEVEERMFEPFFTTKEVGRGTGLGLSVSQQIVARHGGRIEARSGGGTTCFRVVLPLP